MELTVTRLDEHRYETVIRRGDGVRFHVKGVGHMFAIPHDLAHLAIEQALGLGRGFCGSVADGAVFESMTHLGGRRKPRAAERSRQVLRANRDSIIEAEILVRIFNDALEQGHGADSPVLRERIDRRWAAPGSTGRSFTDDEIAAACEAWEGMRALWNELPVGGRLELEWEMESSGSSRRPR